MTVDGTPVARDEARYVAPPYRRPDDHPENEHFGSCVALHQGALEKHPDA
jgi:hypothetical protein